MKTLIEQGRVRFEQVVRTLSNGSKQVNLQVFVDGLDCGMVNIVSGEAHDVDAVLEGDMDLTALQKKWEHRAKRNSNGRPS